jgi:RHS repeat-associated protein
LCEARSYELLKTVVDANQPRVTNLFRFAELAAKVAASSDGQHDLPYEDTDGSGAIENQPYRRLIEHERTLYRRDDLSGPLPIGEFESLAVPFESYKLAFTPGLIQHIYGNRLVDAMFTVGGYVHSEGDINWWIPSGRAFFSPNSTDTADVERNNARNHFYLQRRFVDPFGNATNVTFDSHDLLLTETRDALNNRVLAQNEYRVLQPRLVTDANNNRSEIAFDALGMVAGTAIMGKEGEALGDSLEGFDPDLDPATILEHIADPRTNPSAILARAGVRLIYDLHRYQHSESTDSQPNLVYTMVRETHNSDLTPGAQTRILHSFSYSDGFGREIQKKIQVEPGVITGNGSVVSPRWVGNGWTVFNNKGKPVRQFEPFFSDTHNFQFDVRIGVSPVVFYDPLERLVGMLHPNHSWGKSTFDAWRQETWDPNDTVLVADPRTDVDIGDFFRRLPTSEYLPVWFTTRQGGALGSEEQAAAAKAAVHANTPGVAHADALGRTFLAIAHNKFSYSDAPPATPPTEQFYRTRINLDIENNHREIIDGKQRTAVRIDYDLLSQRVHHFSMEAGERWTLNDVAGKALYLWDGRNHQFRTAYDGLRRPTGSFMREGAGPELLVQNTVYGETQPNPESANLRGMVFQVFDQAGTVSNSRYDFKGNLLSSQRQLATDYKTTLDWTVAVPLEATVHTTQTRYDALNRATELTTPDNSIIRPTYNEGKLLERMEANLRGADVVTRFVNNIDYDAKGQRTSIDYENGVRTTYEYDRFTFRLIHMLTTRNATLFPDDCPKPMPLDWPGCQLQNLRYTYDPIGNITDIQDDAQQTRYFLNKRVDPSAQYTYDAIYRLIEATGREHLGQVGGAPVPSSYNDKPHVGILLSASDGNAVGRYLERYFYDQVGNVERIIHRGSDPVSPGWTRAYIYNESSLIEPGLQSNRLTSTTIGAITETYSTDGDGYDLHGNMLRMPQLQIMQWNFKDQLQMTQRQAVNIADDEGVERQGERTWYVYDSTGKRVRKVTESPSGAVRHERVYFGHFEVYRRSGINALVRETLHIMNDELRIALVETRTEGNETGLPVQLIRFQFGNHLGSASLELDVEAQIISYEEYTPYGSTSYQAVRTEIENAKRFRFTAMERDDESGLYYNLARYYAPWLCRWIAADPIGIADGLDLYAYARGNPNVFLDKQGTDAKPPKETGSSKVTNPDPGPSTIPSRPWKEIMNEILYGPPEYVPKLNIASKVLAQEDKLFEGTQGERFKKLIEEAAAKVDLDPGFLAASLIAEESRSSFTKTSGEQDTFVIGADDYVAKKADIDKRIPAASEIHFTSITRDFNEQGREVQTGHFDATKAVLVDAIYLKYGELKVRDVFKAHGVEFESLTPELRFAFTRLAMNPGKTPVESQIEKFLSTRDIADTAPGVLIRTGVTKQDISKPQSGATLVAGRAIHLSQKVFGNVYVPSSQSLITPKKRTTNP